MKLKHLLIPCVLLAQISLFGGETQVGKADLLSAGPLAFSPDGLLFVADAKAASVFAIDLGDNTPAATSSFKGIEEIDSKVAALLGTTADNISIHDLAVNPVSKTPYLSVSRGKGPDAEPVILRIAADGNLAIVELDNVSYSTAVFPNPPEDAFSGEGWRRRNPRHSSITDMAYVDGKVIVAGLSNEEFASTLRSIPYPFSNVNSGAGIEIYHGAHGKYETHSPIRTFIPFELEGELELLAAYTCTPLVRIPVSQLNSGAKVKGTTIAELGNRNRPLDIIVYENGGETFFLMANSSRGVMKIATNGIESYEAITSRVGDKEGVTYETIENWEGVMQLALLDSGHAMVMTKKENGLHDLQSRMLP